MRTRATFPLPLAISFVYDEGAADAMASGCPLPTTMADEGTR